MAVAMTVLVGTTKGLFLLDGAPGAEEWALRGPFCDGWPMNYAVGDAASGALWAAGGGAWEGAGVWRSDDGGDTWTLAKLAGGEADAWIAADPEMAGTLGVSVTGPAPFTGEITAVWSLCRIGGQLYAGAKPATLLVSDDDGATWARVDGLDRHPTRKDWQPGAAGLVLHTIVPAPDDPERLWVGISAAGVFATEDGGTTWQARNRRSNADVAAGRYCPSGHPAAGDDTEIGTCVHNMVRAPSPQGDLLYQQNHHGVFRSGDGGRNWREITRGLPSTFGFPIAVHPDDPQTIWVLPLNGDSKGRYPPEARPAVWRSRDGGETWQDYRAGLPERDCFFTVLRQAMATAPGDRASVVFGTNTGSVFASRDEGESWQEIARHLPTILSVETLSAA